VSQLLTLANTPGAYWPASVSGHFHLRRGLSMAEPNSRLIVLIGMAKFFLALFTLAVAVLIGAFVFAALTL